MSATELLAQIESLPKEEQARIAEETIRLLDRQDHKVIHRLLRRLADPAIPASFWDGVEAIEDGRVVDMETALHERPPAKA